MSTPFSSIQRLLSKGESDTLFIDAVADRALDIHTVAEGPLIEESLPVLLLQGEILKLGFKKCMV